jgi:hypothetical protein
MRERVDQFGQPSLFCGISSRPNALEIDDGSGRVLRKPDRSDNQ